MTLPESIQRAWADTDYRVRLPRGGYAGIRVGAPLPAALHVLLGEDDQAWGFVTAWNPHSVALPRARNRQRQRELRDALRSRGLAFRAGIGVGPDGWSEPSLFVVGVDPDDLDQLSRRFGQAAIVRGRGAGIAELRVLI